MNNFCGSNDLLDGYKISFELNDIMYNFLKMDTDNKVQEKDEYQVNGQKIHIRIGRVTPKKIGHFVTFWKRDNFGKSIPHDVSELFDFLVVGVRDNKSFGKFIFPKFVLYENGLLSKNGKGGKRGMRIYSPRDLVQSKQAYATQKWQIKYFFKIE